MRECTDVEIEGKTFVLSKFPAIAGREIATQYPLSAVPKLGDYKTNNEIMLKIMRYVGVRIASNNSVLWLSTPELVDNHIDNWEILMKVEYAAMEYNCSFLRDGKISSFLTSVTEKLPLWISKTATVILDSSSTKEKRRSKSSKNTTP